MKAKFRSLLSKLRRSDRGGEGGANFDPDDRWSNLYREREKNNIYKWVGIRTGQRKTKFGEIIAGN